MKLYAIRVKASKHADFIVGEFIMWDTYNDAYASDEFERDNEILAKLFTATEPARRVAEGVIGEHRSTKLNVELEIVDLDNLESDHEFHHP